MIEELLRESINKNGWLKVRLKGKSMRPFLNDGEILIVSRVLPEDISVGNIILYSSDTGIVCHRVFRKEDNGFEIKPDAGIRPDIKIGHGQLIGRVSAIQRKGRIFRLDKLPCRLSSILISRLSIITACLYVIAGKLTYLKGTFHATGK
jgi:signal peptidase I